MTPQETKRKAVEIRRAQIERLVKIWKKLQETGASFDTLFRLARLTHITALDLYHIAAAPIPKFPLGSPPSSVAIVGASDRPEVVVSSSGLVVVQNPLRTLPGDARILPDIDRILKNLEP